jgi:cell division septation protein DedD
VIFKEINIFIFLLFCLYLIGCSSGEYDVDQTQIESVNKTLKYDTLNTSKIDTAQQKEDYVEKNTKETYTFIVQIGAFADPSNFQRFFEQAKSKLGEDVYNIIINNLYKIRLGSFTNKGEALKLLDYVKSLGYSDAFIVTVINK